MRRESAKKNGGPRDPTTGRLSERRREPARVVHAGRFRLAPQDQADAPADVEDSHLMIPGLQRRSARPTTARFRSATSGGRRFAANRFCTNSPRLVVKIERWDCEAKAVDVETHDSGDSAQCERVEPQNPRVAHPSSGRLYCTAARLAGGRSEPCLTGPLGQRLAHSDAAARRATRTRKRSGRRQRSL